MPAEASWSDQEDGWLNVLSFVVVKTSIFLYKNCKSWETLCVVKEGDVLMVIGAPKFYDGNHMIRVCGGGALSTDFVDLCDFL